MKFGLKMCNFSLNVMVGYLSDSKVGFGYVIDLEKSDSEALKIVGFGSDSRISIPPLFGNDKSFPPGS